MNKITKSYLYIFLAAVSVVLAISLLFYQVRRTNIVYASANEQIVSQLENVNSQPEVRLAKLKEKPKRKERKGIYLTANSARNEAKMSRIINLIETTQLNTVVIDIKDYTGHVLYDSNLDFVEREKLENPKLDNIRQLIRKLHRKGIYVIARQAVFLDPALAKAKPQWALKNKQGKIWKNKNGSSWTDPANHKVWNYNIKIAKEAVDLGFDEINFDYVRFPSDGKVEKIRPKLTKRNKHKTLAEFFDYIGDRMRYEPVHVSLDFFGMVMERDGGLNIGQRMKDAVGEVDYISPMMYPSHYPKGHLNFKQPANHPRKVIENGMKKGIKYFKDSKADVRPWLQAFSLYTEYDREKIQAQINTVEKYTDAGWLLWNSRNIYYKKDLYES